MFGKALKNVLIGATAVATLAGATMAGTAADAAPWGGGWHGGGYYHGGGWGPGAVIGAGILGVAIGESLNHPYYGPPPGYYAGPGYWGYYNGCRTYYRWDPRWGHYVRVERCY
jgi:hypothetical protein